MTAGAGQSSSTSDHWVQHPLLNRREVEDIIVLPADQLVRVCVHVRVVVHVCACVRARLHTPVCCVLQQSVHTFVNPAPHFLLAPAPILIRHSRNTARPL